MATETQDSARTCSSSSSSLGQGDSFLGKAHLRALIAALSLPLLPIYQVCAADPAVALIGTNVVPSTTLRAAIARTGLPVNEPATVRKALDDLITHEALAAEAKRLGYDRDPEVEEQTKRLMVQRLVADAVDRVLDKTLPTEADLRSYYDRHQAEFTSAALVRGQVLTLLTKGKPDETLGYAKEAVELAKTTPFEDVVKRYSSLADERLGGGGTGWLVPDAPSRRYPAEVLKALAAAGVPGELAPPVVTDKAVFLVRLSEKRAAQVSSFEQMRPGLHRAVENKRRQRAYDALCQKLRSELGVKVDEAAVQKVIEEGRLSSKPPSAPFRTP